MDLVDSVLATPRGNEGTNAAPTAVSPAPGAVPSAVPDEDAVMDDGSMQVRTMEIPQWLSTFEVTKHVVGGGRKKVLEEEYECTVVVTGKGSGTRDKKAPGYDLPHLLVTMSGTDVRSLGRLRRALEDSLIQYILDNAPEQEEDNANPPPSLGRLLYNLGLSAANASPKTKDHTPDRTVLTRSHFPVQPYKRREVPQDEGDGDDANNHRRRDRGARKVWMNVLELPRDPTTNEYHGRFLASRSFMNYYKSHFHCRVDIYGVWADGTVGLMCAPYALITSEEKGNVDRCIMYVEHRIREHEEKFGVSREGGRRVLRGERSEATQQ